MHMHKGLSLHVCSNTYSYINMLEDIYHECACTLHTQIRTLHSRTQQFSDQFLLQLSHSVPRVLGQHRRLSSKEQTFVLLLLHADEKL